MYSSQAQLSYDLSEIQLYSDHCCEEEPFLCYTLMMLSTMTGSNLYHVFPSLVWRSHSLNSWPAALKSYILTIMTMEMVYLHYICIVLYKQLTTHPTANYQWVVSFSFLCFSKSQPCREPQLSYSNKMSCPGYEMGRNETLEHSWYFY